MVVVTIFIMSPEHDSHLPQVSGFTCEFNEDTNLFIRKLHMLYIQSQEIHKYSPNLLKHPK